MKSLVTGGAGFIGSHLVDKLIELGSEVLVIDNLSTGKKENLNPKARFIAADIRALPEIQPCFEGVDFVFHLAAIPRVLYSVEHPIETSEVNILGTINVFEAALKAKVKKVIFTSSSSVYGNQIKLPLKEDMTLMPVSPYGLQKLVGEQFAKLYFELYQLPIVCLRPFNVYGSRIEFSSEYSLALGQFLKLKSQGKPLTIFGDGEQTRGFCYVDDVVKAQILASQKQALFKAEVINIGSEKSYSINYLADLIGGEKKYLPKRQGDILHTKADVSKAKELLGWQPEVDLAEGVKMTIEWFRSIQK